ncbi:hypothetical protein DXK93_18530 [Achromobacter sp. K91]|uniref:hypothetical protein n=1 Tax=Achromobacter sp. K91 TaxID=2292262 RepID=UPI000E66085C|nr:hypothetical protein [Achromobacter sp. K91]RIJ02180.1 hypothetical protein DXK93_18530 [Achromobacter sp. K91]
MSEKNEWKLVPVGPTDEMETAAEDDYEQRGETFPDWKANYRAMLAAAPTPPASAQDDAKVYHFEQRSRFGPWIEVEKPTERSVEFVQRAAAPAASDAQDLPELNADLIDILGRPNFACIRIAQLLRLGGVEIAKKAEAEQATVIHYLLGFYLKHGSQWAEKADEDIERRRLAALSASQQQEG